MKPEEQAPQTSLFSTHWETTGEVQDVENYRQWSILAMISLILGILSLVAFLYPWCTFLTVIGILVSLAAYVHIRRSDGVLLGSAAAQLGLFLSVLTLTGVSVMWPYYQYTVRAEADRFFRLWFDAVKAKDIRQTVEMRNPSWYRKFDMEMEDWWKSKLTIKGEMDRESVDSFLTMILNDPAMKTLWVLGDRAEISYYKTPYNYYHDSKDTVTSLYAVTVAPPGRPDDRETFFLRISAERTKNPKDAGQFGWALKGFPTVVKELPPELKK